MTDFFADRMNHVPRSFIRDILEVAERPEVISFAGGLPNPSLFPIQGIEEACSRVLRRDGENALQYAQTQGYAPLRTWIAERYQRKGLQTGPDEILITNGSQQAIDLVGKVLIDEGDSVIVEKPGYLGAIQALSMYRPQFHPIPMRDDGADVDALKETYSKNRIKLYYAVTNFQNPSGITYSETVRRQIADLVDRNDTLFVEDNPYGELRFMGDDVPSVRTFCPERSLLFGSFSKIVVPSFRLGWVCAPKTIIDKMIVAKQAADLHTNSFLQRVIHSFLIHNSIDDHIQAIRTVYKKQRDAMVASIEKYFPSNVACTRPEGGMFLWATLPEGMSSMNLFNDAIKENVAFVPGFPFYVDGGGQNTLRLNYSNVNEATIEEGVRRLANVIAAQKAL